MDEARKHMRMPVNLPCRLTCTGQPVPIEATIKNISFGGIGVRTRQQLPHGAIVELPHRTFPFMPDSPSTSQCRVVSSRHSKFGGDDFNISLAFDPIDNAFILKVLQWVQMQALVKKRAQQRTGPTAYR